MRVLSTARLYLREMRPDDAEHIYLLNLNPEVIKYTGDPPFSDILEAKNFLINYDHYKKHGFGRWAVIRKQDEAFLGWCGLKYSTDINEYDIGYRFMKKHWGQGYATESAKACLHWAFENKNIVEIVGRSDIRNKASYKVLEKIGMSFWKNIKSGNQELLIYKISKTDISIK